MMTGRRGWLSFVVPYLLCAGAGLLISVLPHLIWFRAMRAPIWIADYDDMYYLSLGGQAYNDHPARLSDPAAEGTGFIPHRWLVFVPGILAAKSLGWGPL